MGFSTATLLLALTPIRKALDPNDPEDYLRILDQLARATKGLAQPAEAVALRNALDVLDVDWKSMSADARAKVVNAARAAIAAPANSVAQKVSAELSHRAVNIATGAKASNEKRYKWGIDTSLTAGDKRVLESAAKSQVNYIRDQYGRRADAMSAKARDIVAAGLARGLGTKDIADTLRTELTEANRSDSYWNLISSVFANRARTYANLSSYQQAGISHFRFEAVMDDLTSQSCRFLHGRRFEVKHALSTMEQDDVAAQPWVQEGKDADGNPILYYKDPDGARRTVATINQRSQERDEKGKFSGMSDAALAAAGIMLPPLHGNCRSTIVPEDDEESAVAPPPPQPPPPQPPPQRQRPRKPPPMPPPLPGAVPVALPPPSAEPAPYGRNAGGYPLGLQFEVPTFRGPYGIKAMVHEMNTVPAPWELRPDANGLPDPAVRPGMADKLDVSSLLGAKGVKALELPKKGPPYADALKELGRSLEDLVAEKKKGPRELVVAGKLRVLVPQGGLPVVDRKAVRDAIDLVEDQALPESDRRPVVIKHGGKYYVHGGDEKNMALLGARLLERSALATDKLLPRLPAVVVDLDAKLAERAADAAAASSGKVTTPEQLHKALSKHLDQLKTAMDTKNAKLKLSAAAAIRGAVRDYVTNAFPGAESQDVKYDKSGRNSFEVWNERSMAGASAHHDFHGKMVFEQGTFGRLRSSVVGSESLRGDAIRIIFHEELHAHSPIAASAYHGVGVGIEEAQTEILARKLYRRTNPDPGGDYGGRYKTPVIARHPDGRAYVAVEGDGSYRKYVNTLFLSLAEHAPSIKLSEAKKRIEAALEATLTYKHPNRGGPPILTGGEHVDVYVDNLKLPKAESDALKAALKDKQTSGLLG